MFPEGALAYIDGDGGVRAQGRPDFRNDERRVEADSLPVFGFDRFDTIRPGSPAASLPNMGSLPTLRFRIPGVQLRSHRESITVPSALDMKTFHMLLATKPLPRWSL